MSAHEAYELLVGELGIPRREFLYEMKLWEILALQRGREARAKLYWEPARFLAFTIAKSNGAKNINSLQDLVSFPWENDEESEDELPTDEEIEATRRMLQEENKRRSGEA